jgi:hypothetical protein
MTLGQFSTAVGAEPRWVLNALTRLGLPRRYDEPLARRLALARVLSEALHTSLTRAMELSGRALDEGRSGRLWRFEGPDGVGLEVDMARFLTNYGARLSLARTHYGEKPRGRRPQRHGSALERAAEYGFDVTLFDSALKRTPEERIRQVSEDMEFLAKLRDAMRERKG